MKYKFNHYSNKKSDLDKILIKKNKFKYNNSNVYNFKKDGRYGLIYIDDKSVYANKILVEPVHNKPIKKYTQLNQNDDNKIFNDIFPIIEYYENFNHFTESNIPCDFFVVKIHKITPNLYNYNKLNSIYINNISISGGSYHIIDYNKYVKINEYHIINNNFKMMLNCNIKEELEGGYCLYHCEKTERYGVIDKDMNMFFQPTYTDDNLEMLKKDFKHQYCLECNMKKIYEE